jgi:hypothetical protein
MFRSRISGLSPPISEASWSVLSSPILPGNELVHGSAVVLSARESRLRLLLTFLFPHSYNLRLPFNLGRRRPLHYSLP